MRDRSTKAQLLVEGKDDLHVIKALCGRHQVVETFSVQIPAEGGPGGIEALLESIPVRLKISSLRALGIVVDADQNLESRWRAVCARLEQAGYENLPSQPNANGFITVPGNKPKVGVWLMPNNRLPGMLENFVAHLIPDGDPLALQANTCLEKIQDQGLNRYKPVHRPKAFIHTWLAWQENPGQPMGQAITARVLNPGMPLAMTFVNWLDLLFR
jgi:hypothetical protein